MPNCCAAFKLRHVGRLLLYALRHEFHVECVKALEPFVRITIEILAHGVTLNYHLSTSARRSTLKISAVIRPAHARAANRAQRVLALTFMLLRFAHLDLKSLRQGVDAVGLTEMAPGVHCCCCLGWHGLVIRIRLLAFVVMLEARKYFRPP